jgi:serine/threonine protein kinase
VATVYGATDRHLGEDVALKVIPKFGEPEAALRAIRPEYQAVRGLQDGQRHILHIDRPTVCEHSGMDMVLLPMERAEKSFRDWLEETEADPGVEGRLEEGLALLRQACRGVEALHEQGLAHMDLKPENLLLMKEGSEPSEETEWTVKVADFGLARSLRRGEVLNEEVVAEGVGTPYYMAPEQVLAARQEEVGPKADLYASGIILFELLDGKVPFDGSAERVREKHRRVDPPSVRTEVPGRLEELAHRCLTKERGDRPPSAGAIREELTMETSEERAAFEQAREADTIDAWTGFIESYPEGWRTPEAEERLDELKREAKREEWVAEGERLAEKAESALEEVEFDPSADAPGIKTAEEALGQLEEHISSPPSAVEGVKNARSNLQEREQSLRARLEEKREALGERRRERKEELAEQAEEAIEQEAFEESDRLIQELRSVVGEEASGVRRLKEKREKAWEAYRERQEEKQEALIQAVEEAIAEKDLSRAEEKMTTLREEAGGKVAADEAKIERLGRQIEGLRDWLDTRKELVQAARGAIEDENIDRAESKLTKLKNHLGSEAEGDEKLADLTDDLDHLREKQKKIRRKIDAAEEAIEEERFQDADDEIQDLKMMEQHTEVKRLGEELLEQFEEAIGPEDYVTLRKITDNDETMEIRWKYAKKEITWDHREASLWKLVF